MISLDSLINMMINKESKDDDKLDRTTIEHLLLDLFTAGTETTSATLEWSMAEPLKAPEINVKSQSSVRASYWQRKRNEGTQK
ncbi:Cytochrome P450 76C4 [Morus notabilis]|uniref:Cytochrome P450 76C4 n=1 Tax=Morus notabilis TaxID=981085 RepID=W9S308_9ROSA|nr:Cytochrome P450 76C4 [Morus notabilis]